MLRIGYGRRRRGGVNAKQPALARRSPPPGRLRRPTSPLQGEVKAPLQREVNQRYGSLSTVRQVAGRPAMVVALGAGTAEGLGWSTSSVNHQSRSLPQPSPAGTGS
jgi:hypothetical protein